MNKALLVGINAYPAAPLRGCINDISDMASLLVERCGFAMNDVRMLADDRATTAAIFERLNWLVDGAVSGDRLFFHYSGHGTQMATRDHQGEVDGLDEVICPFDFDWKDEHVIRDKDFKRIFGSVPLGVEFIWVSDSCHSGDLSRDIPPPDSIIRQYPAPVDIRWRVDSARLLGQSALTMNRMIEDTDSVALIYGCRSDQTSADSVFDGRANGALTYFLLQALHEEGGTALPLDKLLEVVRAKIVAAEKYRQVPGVEGSPSIVSRPFLAI